MSTFTWTPDAREIIGVVPTMGGSCHNLRDQPERWETVDERDPDAILDAYLSGTIFWCERNVESLLVRDALRHLGYRADLMYDLGTDDTVVLTDLPFGVKP